MTRPSDTTSPCVSLHVLLTGRVQGVGFRYTAEIYAHKFRIQGWIRNLSSGALEAVLESSSQDDLRSMLSWLKKGPPLAQVQNISVSEQPPQGHRDFRIAPTAATAMPQTPL